MQEVLCITKGYRIKRYFLLKSALIIATIFLFAMPASAQEEIEEIEHYVKAYLGEAFNFEGKTIRFKEVVSDSRCPRDVTCVWAGEAKILIEIFKNGKFIGEEIFSTRSQNFSLSKFFQEDFSLHAIALSPYPKTSRKIKASDYQLQFKIIETR
ncbi:hypothetical protein APR41_01920 [Salegentibacter salinarum]|uniref:TonB C-terminal domain-containing protein n=1 Tax=Salegentibacter salinarum TaxID=447422 RepID=A0A2N0U434_9FLAO|nr:hypothetical protein [Salegentibacter salinarum]PKD21763.1 hypothetical protein APR41_01920 [Salegentibacter salinarum]SKB33948.1 hypothetical protein SAMN05660903_00178 [Salegentibacter salinarum]